MSQQSGFSPYSPYNPPPSGPSGHSWSETWIKALTHPTTQDYEEIANDTPADGNGKAYTWIFISTVIVALITIAARVIFPPQIPNVQGIPTAELSVLQSFSLLSIICVPVQAALTIIFIIIYVAITQFFAKSLGGTGTYARLMYTVAAYYAPLEIAAAVIGIIPVVNILSIVFGFYGLYLEVLSVKAVNGFGWGKAVVAAVVLWIVVGIVITIVVAVVAALFASSIGSVFSNIIPNL